LFLAPFGDETYGSGFHCVTSTSLDELYEKFDGNILGPSDESKRLESAACLKWNKDRGTGCQLARTADSSSKLANITDELLKFRMLL